MGPKKIDSGISRAYARVKLPDYSKQRELFPLLSLPALRKRNIVFLDLETTGKDPNYGHEIIEIFFLKCDSMGNEIGRFQSLLKPTKRISYAAYRAHGRNNNDFDLQNAPSMEEVLSKLKDFVKPDDLLCGYNIQDFDIPFLNFYFKKLGLPPLLNQFIDVYQIVKNEFKNREAYQLVSLKLEDLAKYLGVKVGVSHQAGADVLTTKEILFKLIQERKETVENYLRFMPWYRTFPEDKQVSLRDRFDLERKMAELREGLEKLEMGVEGNYLLHEYLRPKTVEVKSEQISAAARALEEPVLIGMDTSLGKTVIAFLMVAHLKKKKAGKIILLAPFLEIIADHEKDFKRLMQGVRLGILTGQTRNHEQIIVESDFLMGTPETVCRLSLENKIPWDKVALLIIDEGHKIKEKYYGREIVARYKEEREKPLITVLTATIGEKVEEVQKMLKDFGIPRPSIILKDKKEVSFAYLTEEERILYRSLRTDGLQYILQEAIVAEMDCIRENHGLLEKHSSVKRFLEGIEKLRKEAGWGWELLEGELIRYFCLKHDEETARKRASDLIERLRSAPKEKRQTILKWEIYVSILADYVQDNYQKHMKENNNFSCMKAAGKVGSLRHLLNHLASDHLWEAYLAARRIKKKDTKGAQELLENKKIQLLFEALELWASYQKEKDPKTKERWTKLTTGLELPPLEELARDPRLEEIIKIVKDYRLPKEKVLILTDLRDTVEKIADRLQELGLPVARVWGTQSREIKGMSPKIKAEQIESFRKGEKEILVSTKFLGLGVNLDFDFLIIENLSVNPDEWTQMKGRVGRTREGWVYYLVGDNRVEQVREQELRKRLSTMKRTRKTARG